VGVVVTTLMYLQSPVKVVGADVGANVPVHGPTLVHAISEYCPSGAYCFWLQYPSLGHSRHLYTILCVVLPEIAVVT